MVISCAEGVPLPAQHLAVTAALRQDGIGLDEKGPREMGEFLGPDRLALGVDHAAGRQEGVGFAGLQISATRASIEPL